MTESRYTTKKVNNSSKKRAFLFNLPPEILFYIPSYAKTENDELRLLASLSETSSKLNKFFKPKVEWLTFKTLMQAVVDGDRETVKGILDKKPELLLQQFKELVIESKLTWQRFLIKDETALTFALKKKQLSLVNEIIPYFKILEIRGDLKDGKKEVLRQWEQAIAEISNQQVMQYDFKTQLIDVIANETFSDDSKNELSEETEKALKKFEKTLFPDKAITLDDYFDVEQLLLAAYNAYNNHFKVLQNAKQRSLFYVRVVGLIQSVLIREIAEIFCESFYDVVAHHKPISDRARSLNLYNGILYYHDSRHSRSGIGYQFAVGMAGTIALGGMARAPLSRQCFEKLCNTKKAALSKIEQKLRSGCWPREEPRNKRSCLLL